MNRKGRITYFDVKEWYEYWGSNQDAFIKYLANAVMVSDEKSPSSDSGSDSYSKAQEVYRKWQALEADQNKDDWDEENPILYQGVERQGRRTILEPIAFMFASEASDEDGNVELDRILFPKRWLALHNSSPRREMLDVFTGVGEATLRYYDNGSVYLAFELRALPMEDHIIESRIYRVPFQSTRPRGARLSAHLTTWTFLLFQSTRPRGARLTTYKANNSKHLHLIYHEPIHLFLFLSLTLRKKFTTPFSFIGYAEREPLA